MAKKNETMETPASSPTAGAKTKNSANALAAKLKTRRLRTVVGAVVFVGMAAGLDRRGEHGHDVRLRLGHVLDAMPPRRARHHDRHEDDDPARRGVASAYRRARARVRSRLLLVVVPDHAHRSHPRFLPLAQETSGARGEEELRNQGHLAAGAGEPEGGEGRPRLRRLRQVPAGPSR